MQRSIIPEIFKAATTITPEDTKILTKGKANIPEDTQEQNPGRDLQLHQAPSSPTPGAGRLPLYINFWK